MMLENIKNEKIVIGVKQSKRAVLAGEAKYLIIARDAEEKVLNEILSECAKRNIDVRKTETMASLGKSAGIDIGAAVVAVLN